MTAAAAPPISTPETRTELAPGVTIGKLAVMVAALISLYIDQSFAGVYGTIQSYAGGSLGMTADELSWTTVGYNACYYTIILLSPWLINRFGRRQVFGLGHLFFGVTSLYLALTGSLHGFVIGRCIEGIAQGTFFVCSVATVLTLFPAKLRGIAFSFFSVTSLSGAASGQFVGGWFIDHAYWRGAFALYAVMAVFAGAVVGLLLEAKGPDESLKLDWVGVVLFFVAIFSFQFDSAYGERRDWLWDPWIDAYIAIGSISAVAFVLWELSRGERAFILLRLFSIRNLWVGSTLGFGLGVPLFGGNEFLQYAEQQLGFPPSTAGALLTMRIIAIVFVAPTAVLLVNADLINVKIPVTIGFLLVPASYALLAMQTTYQSDFATFAIALIMQGAGFACLFSPIANVTIRSLPQLYTAQGIAIFKLVLLLGGSLASTLLTVLYDHDFDSYLTLLSGVATRRTLDAVGALTFSAGSYAHLVSQQASVLAYADNSKWIAVGSLVLLPLIPMLQKPK